MTNIRSSMRNVFNALNPYHDQGGMQAFVSDARKEGLIKPVFYGLAVGAGAFDISSEIGKNLIRKPFGKFIAKPLKRIMGLEKPKTPSFKENLLEVVQSPEVTFGISSGVGAALALTGVYGVHKLMKTAFSKRQTEKDTQKA